MGRFDGGWIKIWRQLDRSWITEDSASLSIFVILLLWANYKDSKISSGRRLKTLKSGQIITSIRELKDRLKIGENTIRSRLKMFESDKILTIETTNQGTIITICNWEKFQGNDEENNEQNNKRVNKRVNERTANGQQTGGVLSEEVKKVRSKEGKKDIGGVNNSLSTSSDLLKKYAVNELFDLWNQYSGPKLAKINVSKINATSSRYRKAKSRLIEEPDLAYWRQVILKLSESNFCTGDNERGWKANIDFLLRPETHLKISEGQYSNKKNQQKSGVEGFNKEEAIKSMTAKQIAEYKRMGML